MLLRIQQVYAITSHSPDTDFLFLSYINSLADLSASKHNTFETLILSFTVYKSSHSCSTIPVQHF